jgi:uncharacterized membrane protein YsdA (DUF1294 family)
VFSVVCIYIAAINLAAFLAFAADKRAANAGQVRVSEGALLALAAVGGAFGAVCAQQVLGHKTRKEPFKTYLGTIIVLELAALFGLAWPMLRALMA